MELNTTKGNFFLFLLLLLFLPFLNSYLRFIKSGPLLNTPLAMKPHFSFSGWWDGSYQAKRNDYVNDNIAFRPDMIRAVNQLDYSLFGVVHAPNVVLGLHSNLFYDEFIDECCGKNFLGDNHFAAMALKLKAVQDTLEHMGKTFVWVYAPSKASYFYDQLPDGLVCKPDTKTNLNAQKHLFDSLGVHYVDFNAWYVALRAHAQHPLFTKQGIHWSIYGAYFATDSLISYIEKDRKITMSHPFISSIETSKVARKIDDDVEHVLNLIFPIDSTSYWYPVIHYNTDSTKTKPRVIYIGDSFMWGLLDNGIMQANTDPEFWYYFREVYDTNYYKGPVTYDMPAYDWKSKVMKADCIIIMYTPPQLRRSEGSGFPEALYDYFYNSKIAKH